MWFRSWLDPFPAAASSLAVVVFFIGLLGIVFLPREARQLAQPQYVSVTHSLATRTNQPAVSLFRAMDTTGTRGCRRHVAIHGLDVSPLEIVFPCPLLNPFALAPGPDADHALVGNCDGTIYLLDLRHPTAEPIQIGRQSDGGVIDLACFADGRFVVSLGSFHLYVWDLATHSQRWRREDVAANSFSLHPDSNSAILSTRQGELIEIDLANGRTVRTLARYRFPALATALSPDGRQLAIALAPNGSLRLLDSQTAAVRWDAKSSRICGMATAGFLAFSPSGKLLVTAGQNSGKDLTVWNAVTGQPIKELRGHTNFVSGAAFATEGSLRSWGIDGTIRVWNLNTGIATRVISLMPPTERT
jgi:WD40 repeat protein